MKKPVVSRETVRDEGAIYRDGVAWIALNDGDGDAEYLDPKHVSEMVSVALLADIFGKTTAEVGRAVVRYRTRRNTGD